MNPANNKQVGGSSSGKRVASGTRKSAGTESGQIPRLKNPGNGREELKQQFALQSDSTAATITKPSGTRVRFETHQVLGVEQRRIDDVRTTFESKEKVGRKELDSFEGAFRTTSLFPEAWLDNHRKQCHKATSAMLPLCQLELHKAGGIESSGWGKAARDIDAASGAKLSRVAGRAWNTLIPPARTPGLKSEREAGHAAFEKLPLQLKESLKELGQGLLATDKFRNAHPESQAKLLHNAAVFAFFQGIQQAIKPDQERLQELRKLPNGKDRPAASLSAGEKAELQELTAQVSYFQKISMVGSYLCGTSDATVKVPDWLQLSKADKTRGAAFFQAWEKYLIAHSGWTEPAGLRLKPNVHSKALRTQVRSGKTDAQATFLVKATVSNKDESTQDLGQVSALLQKAKIDPVPQDLKGVIGNFDQYIRRAVYKPGGLKKRTQLEDQTRWQIDKQADGSVVATYSIVQKQQSGQNISSAAVTGKIVFLQDGSWEVRSPLVHVAPQFRRPARASN